MNETRSPVDSRKEQPTAHGLGGQTIGGYQIVQEIGRGSRAVVYRARDSERDCDIALKVLHPVSGEDGQAIDLFLDQFRQTTQLEHDGIVGVHDLGHDRGYLYIAMALMPGGSLRDRLAEEPLELEMVVPALEHVANALDYIHSEGFVHGHIKPSNVLFDGAGQAALVDLGLARALENAGLVPTGTQQSTLPYMAPELHSPNTEIGSAADVYSLGALAYEMLTSRAPSRPLLTESLDKGIVRTLSRALTQEPSRRLEKASDFVDLLWSRLSRVRYAKGLLGQNVGGRYTIYELIAIGGTGIVYRALDEKDESKVALKVKLISKLASLRNEDSVRRFRREFTGLSKLHHEHIIPVYDTGIDRDLMPDHDVYYTAMELVEGETLEEKLERLEADDRRMNWNQIVSVVQDIAEALDYIHGHELEFVHRDVTPNNIMLVGNDAYLFDFGLVKSLNLPDGSPERSTIIDFRTLTADDAAMGTPGYWAPEQIEGGKVDRRADIYALGAVLYRMLTAQRPFQDDPSGIRSALQLSSPQPSHVDRAAIAFDPIVVRAMARDPSQRYQSARELAEALEAVLGHTPHIDRGREYASAYSVAEWFARCAVGLFAISLIVSVTLFVGIRSFGWFRQLPSGWQSFTQGLSMVSEGSGDYSVTVTEEDRSYIVLEEGEGLTSLNASLEAMLVSGPPVTAYGLVFQYVGDSDYHIFAITGAGQVGVWERKGNDWIALTKTEESWIHRGYIHRDRPNRLEVTIEGGWVRGWINNQPEFEFELGTVQPGRIGFFISTARDSRPTAVIRFANYTVRK